MIHKVQWDAVLIEIGDDRVLVTGLPLQKRRRFTQLQVFLSQIIQSTPELSIGGHYDSNGDFAFAIDESLSLFGLSAESLSAAQVCQLLFAYQGREGALWQLEFPDSEEVKGRVINPAVDPYHAAIAAVWSYSPDLSLGQIVDSIDEIPWRDVEGILAERHRVVAESDPALKAKADKEKAWKRFEESGLDDFINSRLGVA